MTPGRLVLLCLLSGAALAAVGVAVAAPWRAAEPSATAAPLLPDLVVRAPTGIVIAEVTDENGERHDRLSFDSAAINIGRGPLFITGERASDAQPAMTATQVVSYSDGSTTRVPHVGTLRYVTDPTHQHWHLLPFMRYELRRASDGKLVRPDSKTGFCLGDRFDANARTRTENEPADPVYRSNCGLGETGLLTMEEGISPGYGDNYDAWRDGQYIDVTGVKPGRYLLVHHVNVPRRLREASYRNNSSSALIRLLRPEPGGDAPGVDVLAICPRTARCPAKRHGRG